MSQTLEQFQAYQTRLEQYDQAIALLYWDLQTAAPSTRNMSQKRHVPKKPGRQPRRLLIFLYLRPIWIRSSP